MPSKKYRDKAKARKTEIKNLLDNLNDGQRKKLHKDYPFPREREEVIQELAEKGVEQILLREITGISSSTLSRIVRGEGKYKRMSKVNNQDLHTLKKCIDTFSQSLWLSMLKMFEGIRKKKSDLN